MNVKERVYISLYVAAHNMTVVLSHLMYNVFYFLSCQW